MARSKSNPAVVRQQLAQILAGVSKNVTPLQDWISNPDNRGHIENYSRGPAVNWGPAHDYMGPGFTLPNGKAVGKKDKKPAIDIQKAINSSLFSQQQSGKLISPDFKGGGDPIGSALSYPAHVVTSALTEAVGGLSGALGSDRLKGPSVLSTIFNPKDQITGGDLISGNKERNITGVFAKYGGEGKGALGFQGSGGLQTAGAIGTDFAADPLNLVIPSATSVGEVANTVAQNGVKLAREAAAAEGAASLAEHGMTAEHVLNAIKSGSHADLMTAFGGADSEAGRILQDTAHAYAKASRTGLAHLTDAERATFAPDIAKGLHFGTTGAHIPGTGGGEGSLSGEIAKAWSGGKAAVVDKMMELMPLGAKGTKLAARGIGEKLPGGGRAAVTPTEQLVAGLGRLYHGAAEGVGMRAGSEIKAMLDAPLKGLSEHEQQLVMAGQRGSQIAAEKIAENPKLTEAAAHYAAAWDQAEKTLASKGLNVGHTDAYVPNVKSKEARALDNVLGRKGSTAFFEKARTLIPGDPTASIQLGDKFVNVAGDTNQALFQNVNDALRKFAEEKGVKDASKLNFFETDPNKIHSAYGTAAAARVGQQTFIDKMTAAGLHVPEGTARGGQAAAMYERNALQSAVEHAQLAAKVSEAHAGLTVQPVADVAQSAVHASESAQALMRQTTEEAAARATAIESKIHTLDEEILHLSPRSAQAATRAKEALQEQLNWAKVAASGDLPPNLHAAAAYEQAAAGLNAQIERLSANQGLDSISAMFTPKRVDELGQLLADEAGRAADSGLASPEQMQEIMAGVEQFRREPGKFGDYYNKVFQLNKKMLLLRPGFPIKHSFGKLFVNWQAEVDVASHIDALALLKNGAEAAGTGTLKDVTPEMANIALEQGGFGGMGKMPGELGMNSPLQGRSLMHQIGGHNVAPNLSATVSDVVSRSDTFTRTAMAIDVLKKGGSAEDVAAKIAKYHFDYSDLSKVEQTFIKKIVPFWTFTRKMLPLQVEMFVRRPGTFAKWELAKQELDRRSGKGADAGWMSSVLPGGGANLPGGGAVNPSLLPYSADFGNVQDVAHGPADALAAMVSPIIKAPIESALFNKQVFLKEDLPGKPVQLGLPGPLAEIVGPILAQTPGVRAQQGKDGKWYVDDRTTHVLEGVLPQLAQFSRLAGQDKKYKESRLPHALTYGTGVQFATEKSIRAKYREPNYNVNSKDAVQRAWMKALGIPIPDKRKKANPYKKAFK